MEKEREEERESVTVYIQPGDGEKKKRERKKKGVKETTPASFRCLRSNSWKFSKAYKDELRAMLTLAWPVTVSALLEQFVFTINAMFTGHLGRLQLDATALGQAVFEVFGSSIMVGINTACDTLFSQTYGSTNKKNLGILLQRALLLNMLACIPCISLYMNVERILLAVGQNPDVSRLSGEYITACIPALPVYAAVMVMSKYLCAQGIVRPTLVILLVSNVFNLFSLDVFLHWAGLDMVGAALAVCVTYGACCIMHALYIYGSNINDATWTGWSSKCWLEWKHFSDLAVPGFMMIAMSWWSIQIVVVLTGYIGKVQLAAQAVLFQIVALIDMLPYGMSTAAGMRIGNLLGSGDHVACQTANSTAKIISGIFSAVVGAVLTLFGGVIAEAFTDDDEVADQVKQVMPILTIYLCIKTVSSVFGGVLRGIGQQRFGACVTFLSYYVICLPLGLPLMFLTSLGIAGIWISYTISATFLGVCCYVRLNNVDWKKEVVLAQERAGAKGKKCSEMKGGDYSPLIQEDCASDDEDYSHESPSRINEPRGGLMRVIVSRLLIALSIIGILVFGVTVRTMPGRSHLPECATVPGFAQMTSGTFCANQTELLQTLNSTRNITEQ
ncbi:multidrug and toxin extrusion protein 1-like [Haliotis rubra]|uniref:multidrug and toxin extrusion protein 1-like n=1 Tax=Haliotis rubra TaxID=36100 RepID=UPI001EE54C1D|nr:multidrug and toxin extrusion protein 1-like [Haliotis rubra]